MPTLTQQKAAARHQARLDEIKEQIENGTLVVRKMTAEERKRWGAAPSPRAGKGPAARRRKRS